MPKGHSWRGVSSDASDKCLSQLQICRLPRAYAGPYSQFITNDDPFELELEHLNVHVARVCTHMSITCLHIRETICIHTYVPLYECLHIDSFPDTSDLCVRKAGVPFFSIAASEFVEVFAGVGASRVRDLFEQAKKRPGFWPVVFGGR